MRHGLPAGETQGRKDIVAGRKRSGFAGVVAGGLPADPRPHETGLDGDGAGNIRLHRGDGTFAGRTARVAGVRQPDDSLVSSFAEGARGAGGGRRPVRHPERAHQPQGGEAALAVDRGGGRGRGLLHAHRRFHRLCRALLCLCPFGPGLRGGGAPEHPREGHHGRRRGGDRSGAGGRQPDSGRGGGERRRGLGQPADAAAGRGTALHTGGAISGSRASTRSAFRPIIRSR
mgnify:CR=1 FL=1